MFKFLNFIFIIPIKLYQILLSPLLGQSCRYHPTCSQYAVEAIEKYGPIKGIWLGIKRIARCHPWGGLDMILSLKYQIHWFSLSL